VNRQVQKISGFFRSKSTVRYNNAIDSRIFRRGAYPPCDIEPMRQLERAASHPSRFGNFKFGERLRLRDVFQHIIDGDQPIARVGDGSTGGNDFD